MDILNVQAQASAAETSFINYVADHAPNVVNFDGEGQFGTHAGSYSIADATQLVAIDRADFRTHVDVQLDEEKGALFSRRASVELYAADVLVRRVSLAVGDTHDLYVTTGDEDSEEVPSRQINKKLTAFLGSLTAVEEKGGMHPIAAASDQAS